MRRAMDSKVSTLVRRRSKTNQELVSCFDRLIDVHTRDLCNVSRVHCPGKLCIVGYSHACQIGVTPDLCR